MIQIQDLCKRFGRVRVLNGTTCTIQAGQSVALWGPNGAGKTTLLRCVLGLIDFQGQVHVGGLDIRRHGKCVRRSIGYVPQEMTFYDDYRIHEVVRLIARLRSATRHDVTACLPGVGLEEHRRKRVRELSGGMKQRLALGLALLNDPPVLALDEPTSNLDTDARRELLGRLIGLKQAGKTILFISHRPEEVGGLADRVLTLEHGRIVADQSALTFASPVSKALPKSVETKQQPPLQHTARTANMHGPLIQGTACNTAFIPALCYPEVKS
jgi:ABC-2 type transport system ATP-binding protein/nitrous oxidase accessory protein